jgi:hypothetical protein
MSFVEVFCTDIERGELWKGGWRAKATIRDIFDLVIGNQVLRHAAYGHRKSLADV